MKRTLPFAVAVAIAHPAFAEDSRQLDAHEHGVGELNIALEETTVSMELHAPGADIVGFEYEAKSAEDRSAIDAAVAMLAKPQELFVLPASAECTVTQASAELESEEEHEKHAAGEEHHDEEEEHAEGEDHDDDEEHAKGEHDDGEHADEAGHTEFHAEYVLTCANPSAIDEITFAYFDAFESARELEVKIVTKAGAQAFEVERDEPRLDLRGMF
ncbi:MAG: zinc uptake protein ZrgA [Pseudomonadales bacterium]